MPIRRHTKRHAQAFDATLTDEQRDAIFLKATTGGLRWDSIVAWAAETLPLAAKPSRASFYRFLDFWRPHYVARRVQERALARDALRAEREQLGDLSPELAQSLEDQAAASIAGGDLDAGRTIFGIAAKIREDLRKRIELDLRRAAEARANDDLQLKVRRLDLLERKLAEARDTGETIDPARLADEVDRILGRKTA